MREHDIKVDGKIGKKSVVDVTIDGVCMRFDSVIEATQTLLKAIIAVNDWAESEYQAGRTNRRFKDSNG